MGGHPRAYSHHRAAARLRPYHQPSHSAMVATRGAGCAAVRGLSGASYLDTLFVIRTSSRSLVWTKGPAGPPCRPRSLNHTGIDFSANGYYSNGAGFSYSSGYLPSYTTNTVPTMNGYYAPPAVGASSTAVPPSYDTAPADASAHIRMEVPAGAEIWIDGAKTLQTGNVRNFVSP